MVTYRCNNRTAKTTLVCKNKEVNKHYLERFVLNVLSDIIFDEKYIPERMHHRVKYYPPNDFAFGLGLDRMEQIYSSDIECMLYEPTEMERCIEKLRMMELC